MPGASQADPRAAAATVISQLLNRQGSLSNLLPGALATVDPRDHGLLRELCFGVARLAPRLEAMIGQLVRKPLKRKDRDIHALLLLGAYQLGYTRIPDHAAIGATVEAARALDKHWAKAFINGVLRQYQRRAALLEANLSVEARLAHPPWLLERIQAAWGEHAGQIFEANNLAPPMALRVNLRKLSREDYLAALQEAAIDATASHLAPAGVRLAAARDTALLPGFARGWASVQDESAQLAAPLVLAGRPHRVLDACAAPGGKTCHLLEAGADDVAVDALDVSPKRLALVHDNLARLGFSAKVIEGDAAHLSDWWDGTPYDAILLDAPCSSTGVIRRHPDIKLLRTPTDIHKLVAVQGRLLRSLWQCLRPGGTLVYATCSILPEENVALTRAFLDETADAEELPIDADWGFPQTVGRQLLPRPDAGDGFYYACLRRRKA